MPMVDKQVVVVVVIKAIPRKPVRRRFSLVLGTATTMLFSISMGLNAQEEGATQYKKRVLETTEIDFLSSYYGQDGDNAAVTGGIGTEELSDVTGTFIVAIPMNDDDVLTIDAGVSAYTSASSSNVNPFDGRGDANAFVASTGASSNDVYSQMRAVYSIAARIGTSNGRPAYR